MRHTLLTFALLVTASLPVFAQSDGFNWQRWDKGVKIGFVMGYLEATHVKGEVAHGVCLTNVHILDAAKIAPERWKEICEIEYEAEDYVGIPMGQFVEGTDAFYSDYRHKNLEIGFALQYVRDQMRGKKPQDLDAEVEQWQRTQQSLKK